MRNAVATGRLTLVAQGRQHALQRPELIPTTQALAAYPRWQQRTVKTRGVEHFLWAHKHAAGNPPIQG